MTNRSPSNVLRFSDYAEAPLRRLLHRYGLDLREVAADEAITGSFWGDEEAGLVDDGLYLRTDTPLHSILHEACHYICMTPDRRRGLDTNAGGDYDEENAVCYLQILLADELPGFGRERMMQDMDEWGYSFRLGSARAWFENDAEDAAGWLMDQGLIESTGRPSFRLRQTTHQP